MADTAKDQAQEAIFKEVSEIISKSKSLTVGARASIVRSVAFAYRLAAGGAQPGSVEVDAK